MIRIARSQLQKVVSRNGLTGKATPTVCRAGLVTIQQGLSSQRRESPRPINLLTKKCLSSTAETMEFQAETRKLLDIVTHSIYTDKEVFIRELISNASDALEKYRYKQVMGEVNSTDSNPLEISIIADPEKGTLIVSDNGIGMTKEELISNLGTIARSGSKQFVEQLKGNGASSTSEGIIGQFGVGFYSSFMVAEAVSVESISVAHAQGGPEEPKLTHKWSSDGSGVFKIEETINDPSHLRGSRIVMQLKESCKEFANEDRIKGIIQRYSNFVSFPIKLNGKPVNTVNAIWAQDKTSVTEAQYDEFYKFIANAFDKPKFTLHFRADAPIDLKCLLYVPSFHTEKFGMGRMEPGVNLYSRKVLIENKPKDLLPEWLRFIKGVVDSEDLPLSLSREKSQDSALLRRIRDVLTRKLIRFLDEQMRNEPVKYREFYTEFNFFLKEGVCHDFAFMDQLAKLLLFESTAKGDGELTSLDDYVSRCPPEQKQIYYIVAPSRKAAYASPYYEIFKKHGKEVLLLFNTIDDFVMTNIKNFSGRALISAESSSVDLGPIADDTDADKAKDSDESKDKDTKKKDAKSDAETVKLTDMEASALCSWLKDTLGAQKVRDVKITTRLADSPAIITDHESGAMRRMLKMLNHSDAQNMTSDLPPQVLEINPSHPIIVALSQAQQETGTTGVAPLVALQILDNALIAAGLIDDPRMMLSRLNDILLATLKKQ